jgi:hypothetical protein
MKMFQVSIFYSGEVTLQLLAVMCSVSDPMTGEEPPKGNTKGTDKRGRRRKLLFESLKENKL